MTSQLALLGATSIGRRHGPWLRSSMGSSEGPKPAGATATVVPCPPGTVGNSSWLATTPGSFYAGDVWGAARSASGDLAVPSGWAPVIASGDVNYADAGWAVFALPAETVDVRANGGIGMVQEARRTNVPNTGGINWGYALNHNGSGGDEIIHWSQTASGETPPHIEQNIAIRVNANRPSGYQLYLPFRHIQLMFLAGGGFAGTWELYGDGGLGEGVVWGTVTNSGLDQSFEADLPATTTRVELVMHPTSGNVFSQRVWANFTPVSLAANTVWLDTGVNGACVYAMVPSPATVTGMHLYNDAQITAGAFRVDFQPCLSNCADAQVDRWLYSDNLAVGTSMSRAGWNATWTAFDLVLTSGGRFRARVVFDH